MIRYKQEYNSSGSGLGCQISAYLMMRALEQDTGFDWAISSQDFNLLRNTFDLTLKVDDSDTSCVQLELDDEVGYNYIKENVTDNTELCVYPTSKNFNCEHNIRLRSELKFKKNIVDKCRAFRDKFDGEVIAMHVRRGDFLQLSSGMFICGADYYRKALEELPEDLPVLIFTNDKDNVILDHELVASNPDRFTFITDLYNDNELINCDVGQELDRLIDNDGKHSKFNYKTAIVRMAHNSLRDFASDTNGYTMDQLKSRMSEYSGELHPKYKKKIREQAYNASYDLCLMTMCDYVIMANSSYAFWGVTLGNPKKVVYPTYWMQGHPEDGNALIKSDLNGFNQTKHLIGSLIEEHFIPMENPDPRSFEVLS